MSTTHLLRIASRIGSTAGDGNFRYWLALPTTLASRIVVDEQTGIIVFVEIEAERLFGYHRTGELLGCKIETLVPDAVRHRHEHTHRAEYAANPQPLYMGSRMHGGFHLEGRKRDGSNVPISITLTPRMYDCIELCNYVLPLLFTEQELSAIDLRAMRRSCVIAEIYERK